MEAVNSNGTCQQRKDSKGTFNCQWQLKVLQDTIGTYHQRSRGLHIGTFNRGRNLCWNFRTIYGCQRNRVVVYGPPRQATYSRLVGWYATRFLDPIDCSKIPALKTLSRYKQHVPQRDHCKRAILFLSSSKILTPHPPLRPACLSSPRNKGGGYTLAGRRGGWGVNILQRSLYGTYSLRGLRQVVFALPPQRNY